LKSLRDVQQLVHAATFTDQQDLELLAQKLFLLVLELQPVLKLVRADLKREKQQAKLQKAATELEHPDSDAASHNSPYNSGIESPLPLPLAREPSSSGRPKPRPRPYRPQGSAATADESLATASISPPAPAAAVPLPNRRQRRQPKSKEFVDSDSDSDRLALVTDTDVTLQNTGLRRSRRNIKR
jgi:hypothetical protein